MTDSNKGNLSRLTPTSTHWGNYLIETRKGDIVAVHPYEYDSEPALMSQSLVNTHDHGCRVPTPKIRKGYLQKKWASDGRLRGNDIFVSVPWDEALDIAAEAIERVRCEYGNESIYGGNYGWASAGRFHHANSQVHRFLNACGGYTASVDSYSFGAAQVIMPHVLGTRFHELMFEAPTIDDICANTRLVICFGGIPIKNTQVMSGGVGAHSARKQLQRLKEKAVRFINVSPIKDDIGDFLDAQWWPCRPNSDTAIMLGIAHTLFTEDCHDRAFLKSHCVGFEIFLDYLLGRNDGMEKDASWASGISGISAENICKVARDMARDRSLIGLSWSLQRSEFGEQPYWMATLLAAMLGHIGLPGGGVAYGFGSVHNIGFAGRRLPNFKIADLAQGKNAIDTFIPVARLSDMLLNPGQEFDYNGSLLKYPNIKLVYWAGGNPFHHHQDINRLRQAWSKPESIIINEPFWTATARHADIVFPGTTPLERNDICASPYDCYLSPMRQVVKAYADSRSDYDIFSGLAARLGCKDAFTEGRDEMAWVESIYNTTVGNAKSRGIKLPDFRTFWSGQAFSIEDQLPEQVFTLERFRSDPENHPLNTPSGRIECYSETIASFNYPDCRGHPVWFEGTEWLGSVRASLFPLHLISNQPKNKLHSQYDHGIASTQAKIKQRAAARMNSYDANRRNIASGDIVRIFNERGACLAGIIVCDAIRRDVIELETGAWYDPLDAADPLSLEIHGNPNVLTRDAGTSRLAQACSAHSCLVEVEQYTGNLPAIRVFEQPAQSESRARDERVLAVTGA